MTESSITVPMPAALAHWVKSTAAREDRTMAAQVRHVLTQAMRAGGDATANLEVRAPGREAP